MTNENSPLMEARVHGYCTVADVGCHNIQQQQVACMKTLLSKNHLDGCMNHRMLGRMNRIYPKNILRTRLCSQQYDSRNITHDLTTENWPIPKLSHTKTVPSQNCPISKLSHTKTVRSQNCPIPKLSHLKTVPYQNCPIPKMSRRKVFPPQYWTNPKLSHLKTDPQIAHKYDPRKSILKIWPQKCKISYLGTELSSDIFTSRNHFIKWNQSRWEIFCKNFIQ